MLIHWVNTRELQILFLSTFSLSVSLPEFREEISSRMEIQRAREEEEISWTAGFNLFAFGRNPSEGSSKRMNCL